MLPMLLLLPMLLVLPMLPLEDDELLAAFKLKFL
jgi:hypothetical protein